MDSLKLAYEMYKREHDRWRDWAIFFVGSIASVFIVWKEIREIFPLWVPCVMSSTLSLFWILASLSIRATTDAWRETIKELESNLQNTKVMSTFYSKLENRKHKDGKSLNQWKDFIDTVNFFKKIWWKKYIFSVTRLLVWIGLILFVVFFIMTVYTFFHC